MRCRSSSRAASKYSLYILRIIFKGALPALSDRPPFGKRGAHGKGASDFSPFPPSYQHSVKIDNGFTNRIICLPCPLGAGKSGREGAKQQRLSNTGEGGGLWADGPVAPPALLVFPAGPLFAGPPPPPKRIVPYMWRHILGGEERPPPCRCDHPPTDRERALPAAAEAPSLTAVSLLAFTSGRTPRWPRSRHPGRPGGGCRWAPG